MRVLSGTQPSASHLHIGNYFGALRQFIALQDQHEALYFIADYHSMNSVRDAAERRALHARGGARLPRLRARSEARDPVPPVGRARGLRARLAALDGDADGPAGTRARLQGQAREAAVRRSRPVRVSRADGGGHPALPRRSGAGRAGPEAAHRDDARHGGALQPRLRRGGAEDPRALHPRGHRGGPRHRRAQDEQVLPELRSRCSRRPARSSAR